MRHSSTFYFDPKKFIKKKPNIIHWSFRRLPNEIKYYSPADGMNAQSFSYAFVNGQLNRKKIYKNLK